MKAIKILVALFLIFNIYTPVVAQSNFRDGLVVANGDTIHGQVDYKQWERNPIEIKFKNNAGQVVKYGLDDISYFEINGLDKYQKGIVNKDIRPVEVRHLFQGMEDVYVNDTVFLRLLVNGKVALYQLKDDEKNHFYIKTDDKNFEELIYKVYMDNNNVVTRRPVYIDQLGRFVDRSKDNTKLIARLKAANYKEDDLTKAVQQLNAQDGQEILYTAPKMKQPVVFFAGVGAGYSSLMFKGQKTNLSGLDYDKATTPIITAGIDMTILRNLQDLVVRAELSYYSLKFTGSGTTTNFPFSSHVTYKLKVNSVAPSVSLLYNIFNSPKNKVYLGIGAVGNFSSYPENLYHEVPDDIGEPSDQSPYLSLQKFWISSHARAGWIINKKVEIAGSIKLDGSIGSFNVYSISPSLSSLSVYYRF